MMEEIEDYLFALDNRPLMESVLSKNEERVLWGLTAFPQLNDQELSSRLEMPYSTLSTIRRRLQRKSCYRTIEVPMLQRVGAEMLAVVYTLFNPAITVRERARITTKTIEVFEELFYSVGETHKGFSISISGDYAAIGRINDLRIETFAKAGLFDLAHPREVIFPFSLSRIPRFFDFSPLLGSCFGLPEEPCPQRDIFSNTAPVDLSQTEKRVMLCQVESPEATDKGLAEKLSVSRRTVSKSRGELESEGLLVRRRLPNLVKLGFKVMAFTHLIFNPSKALDDKLLNTNILKNPATVFLAARRFECVILSVYLDYEAYRADHTRMLQFLKENDYLVEIPNTAKFMVPSMVVMKDMIFGPIVKKTLGLASP